MGVVKPAPLGIVGRVRTLVYSPAVLRLWGQAKIAEWKIDPTGEQAVVGHEVIVWKSLGEVDLSATQAEMHRGNRRRWLCRGVASGENDREPIDRAVDSTGWKLPGAPRSAGLVL